MIWEGDEPDQQISLTFAELHREVCLFANGLKALGIKKGDLVGIYLPMIPEAVIAMLACTRIGAIHAVVFAGFSASALQQRLEASPCQLLITCDGYKRGGKGFSLKSQADEATQALDLKTLVIRHNHQSVTFNSKRDYWWHEIKTSLDAHCPPEPMDA